jgi:NTP pyrophosphatase (non-canonical NTP hydrolase)
MGTTTSDFRGTWIPERRQEMKKTYTVKELQEVVDQWIQENGGYFSELTNLGILGEEHGELARIIVREYGDQTPKPDEPEPDLGDELADMIFVVICIANQTNIDLTGAIRKNLEKKVTRDLNRHT